MRGARSVCPSPPPHPLRGMRSLLRSGRRTGLRRGGAGGGHPRPEPPHPTQQHTPWGRAPAPPRQPKESVWRDVETEPAPKQRLVTGWLSLALTPRPSGVSDPTGV